MRSKIISLLFLSSLLIPGLSLAAYNYPYRGAPVRITPAVESSSTEEKKNLDNSFVNRQTSTVAKKGVLAVEKQDLIKKLLDQTAEVYNEAINKIDDMAKRVAAREAIMVSDNTLSTDEKAEIDAKLADETVLSQKVKTEIIDLVNLSSNLVDSQKPGRDVKAVRKASNKVKSDIKAAHKDVVQAITVLRSSYDKSGKSATSTEASDKEGNK